MSVYRRASATSWQAGSESETTNVTGARLITFEVPFASTPSIQVTRTGSIGTAPLTAYVINPSTTSFQIVFFSGLTRQDSTAVSWDWQAVATTQ